MPTWSEVELIVGDHVIQPGTDDPEGHANHDHQLHAVGGTAPGPPAPRRNHHCDDNAGDYAERVRPDWESANVPDTRRRARNGQGDVRPRGRHHAVLITPTIPPLRSRSETYVSPDLVRFRSAATSEPRR